MWLLVRSEGTHYRLTDAEIDTNLPEEIFLTGEC